MKPLTSEQIESVASALSGCVRDEPMAKHTNFRLGGLARLYWVAPNADALIRAIEVAEKNAVPWYVFGGGSNLLVADAGFEGLVIQSGLRDLAIDGECVRVQSGVITGLVARKTSDAGLTGFEWAIGVPGTIGGAIYGNAGCWGGEMKDVVESVDAYRLSDKKRVTYTNTECAFAYRESRFKKEQHLLFGCTLRLAGGNPDEAKQRMTAVVELRKAKQPLEAASAGCAFKNVEFMHSDDIKPLLEHAVVPDQMLANGVISAGWLVQQADGFGLRVGGVAVSDKHGNFLVKTDPSATAADVLALLHQVKERVRDRFGVELHEEVQLLGFDAA